MNNQSPSVPTEEVVDMSPFKRMVLTIGTLPNAFTESLTYYEALAYFVKYLEETVIPAINQNAEATKELQDLFVELKDYVDNYFDNLDVQEEINNKLDAMVEDGTMDTIINQEIFGQLNEQVGTNTENIATNAGNITELNTNLGIETTNRQNADNTLQANINAISYPVNRLRINPDNNINKIVQKVYNVSYGDFEILKGDMNYEASYPWNKIDGLKNSSTHTWYISPNGDDNNDGTTASTPKKNLGLLVKNTITAGDTIILLSGIYLFPSLNPVIEKSCNIIAEKPNTVFITSGYWVNDTSIGTWSQNSTYNTVYQFSHSNIQNTTSVVDLSDKEHPTGLVKVDSLAECASTPGTYAVSTGVLYVHLLNNGLVNQTNVAVSLQSGYPVFFIKESISHIKLYCENLNFMGGNLGTVVLNQSSDGTRHQVAFNKCKFQFTVNDAAMKNIGCTSRCINCEASFNHNDGFSYHNNALGVEYKCKGFYNGHEGAYANNGSTAHGSQIYRMNGEYHHNVGPNIADVQSGVISVNYNCSAYDSLYEGSVVENGSDIDLQTGTMYLLGCHTKGSNSINNLCNSTASGASGGTLYVDSLTDYDTTSGTITAYTPPIIKNVNPWL